MGTTQRAISPIDHCHQHNAHIWNAHTYDDVCSVAFSPCFKLLLFEDKKKFHGIEIMKAKTKSKT